VLRLYVKRFVLQFTLGALLALFGAQARAWAPTFGPEFNFSNPEIKKRHDPDSLNNGVNSVYQLKFRDEVAGRCPECRIEKIKDERIGDRDGDYRYRVFHPDGWSFTISLDPNVVEVQADPMTLEQVRAVAPEMQRLIFDAAGQVGLQSEKNGGQVHIGVKETFEGDPLFFSNFLKDWFYHSRMAFYLFGGDSGNSPTVDMVGSHPHGNLKKIFRMFDARYFGIERPEESQSAVAQKWGDFQKWRWAVTPPEDLFADAAPSLGISRLRQAIVQFVYFRTKRNWSPPEKYQNIKIMERTLELRSVTEVESAGQYVTLLELLQGRLEHVKRFTEPIHYRGINKAWVPQDIFPVYADFAREAGMSWDRAISLAGKRYQKEAKYKNYACRALFFKH